MDCSATKRTASPAETWNQNSSPAKHHSTDLCQKAWKRTKQEPQEEFHVPIEIQQRTFKLLDAFQKDINSI